MIQVYFAHFLHCKSLLCGVPDFHFEQLEQLELEHCDSDGCFKDSGLQLLLIIYLFLRDIFHLFYFLLLSDSRK